MVLTLQTEADRKRYHTSEMTPWEQEDLRRESIRADDECQRLLEEARNEVFEPLAFAA